jgi:hypothetical protein
MRLRDRPSKIVSRGFLRIPRADQCVANRDIFWPVPYRIESAQEFGAITENEVSRFSEVPKTFSC